MKFIFGCPDKHEVFGSASFSILENKGFTTEMDENKTSESKVALIEPCPFSAKNMYTMPVNYPARLEVPKKKEIR
ncbi:MAG: hypothetical protein ABII68_06520 [Pseudomonadota bacterium]